MTTIFDRKTAVPQPNNIVWQPTDLLTTFIEPPSFPRIDMRSDTVASRGNHQPVWGYVLPDGSETRAGHTGIYTNPYGTLITGASNLGAIPDFPFFAVPGTDGVLFDVFPGAPAVTDGATVVFKGNYTVGTLGRTGVYYRDLTDSPIPLLDGVTQLAPAGGTGPVVRIADTDTIIPGTRTTVRLHRPAQRGRADWRCSPASTTRRVPPRAGSTGRRSPERIRRSRRWSRSAARCRARRRASSSTGWVRVSRSTGASSPSGAPGEPRPGSWCCSAPRRGTRRGSPTAGSCIRTASRRPFPVNQGIFVHDTVGRTTAVVAKAPANFSDFVYWNFSGRVPGVGEGGEDDDTGEPARWRSATFVAVSGLVDGSLTDATFHVAFKARTGQVVDGAYVDPIDGIYLRKGPNKAPIAAVVETGMDGTLLDPAAVVPGTQVPIPVTSMGIERDGFRGDALAINVSMGSEEAGWAGIYLTAVPAALR